MLLFFQFPFLSITVTATGLYNGSVVLCLVIIDIVINLGAYTATEL